MKNSYRILILIDAIINLVIGIFLLLTPFGALVWLGLPASSTYFYPLLLGAVIFGIGLALLAEYAGKECEWRGLGLEGAIIINFCGGGFLLFWLLFSKTTIPFRGHVLLWLIALAVLGIGIIEITARFTGKNIFDQSRKI